MWKLISYSEVKLPLEPYLSPYILGIIENGEGKRLIARINQEDSRDISISIKGKVKKQIGPNGKINVFIPYLDTTIRNRGKKKELSKKKIEKIGIIGTGIMGLQLVQLIVQHGFKVVLKSRKKKSLEKASRKIKSNLLRSISSKEGKEIIANVRLTTEVNHLFDSDIIIECIPEDEEVKKNLFKKLSNICSKNTILATNTSSFSIDTLASVVINPSRVIGIHFFNPIEKMRLVEVIQGSKTTPRKIKLVTHFLKKLDKMPLLINDSPGFIVNRLLFVMINEAAYLLEKNKASISKIDIAMKLGANHPMGPFELADFIGIDVVYEIIQKLSLSLPNFKPPAKIFREMIKIGKLGRKTKEGFYKY